jgi:protein MpaA
MDFIELKSGRSVEGDQIKAYRSEHKSARYLYLMAGTHGDEVEGVYVLQKLFDWLKDEEEIKIPMIVIPILNIDGYRAGTRVNSHGVDLNRNYDSDSWSPEVRAAKYNPGPKALSEPENKYLIKLFDKFPPKLILSFHSWKPMINYNGDCQDVAELLEKYNSYPTCDDIEGHPTPGSLGDLAPQTYHSPVLTFECPVLDDNLSLKQIWEENEQGLKTLLKSELLQKKIKSK